MFTIVWKLAIFIMFNGTWNMLSDASKYVSRNFHCTTWPTLKLVSGEVGGGFSGDLKQVEVLPVEFNSLSYLRGRFIWGMSGRRACCALQCTPLLVEKAGVAPDVTLRSITHRQVSAGKRTTLAHGDGYMKSKIPIKWTLVQQKNLKRKKDPSSTPGLNFLLRHHSYLYTRNYKDLTRLNTCVAVYFLTTMSSGHFHC